MLKEQAMDRQECERRNGMPVTETIFIMGIAALMLLNFAGIAFAQSDPQVSPPAEPPSTVGAAPSQVQPTFRVQPTLRDLPPGVAETETLRTKAQKDFDKTLQICRGC
jgi:hypothetical protein